MSNQKKRKQKTIKQQFITVSATSILLLSSLASTGTASTYAAETTPKGTTEQPKKTASIQQRDQQAIVATQTPFKITGIDSYVEGESQFISGTYTGNEPAYIRIVVNGEKKTLLSTKGLPKGTFKYYLSGLKATDLVSIQLFNVNYSLLGEASLTIKRLEPVKITKIDPYVAGNTSFVTGTYTGNGVTYIRLVINDKKTGLIDVTKLPKGSFKYFADNLKATDQVSIQLFDASYRQVATENVPVERAKKVTITEIAPYTEGESQNVTGTYTGDEVAYMRLTVNGQKQTLVSTETLPKGTFNYFTSTLKAADKVTIELFDADYRQVAESTVPIKSTEVVKVTKVDPYIEGKTQFISGNFVGSGAAYMQVIVNGKKQGLVPMTGLPKGQFKYYQAGLKKKDKVTIVLYNKDYKQVATKDVSISEDIHTQTIHTTPYPANTANAGILMGQGHDRQDLGIQLAKGATITIKQTNPNYTGNLTLRLLTNDSQTESAVDFSKSNVSLTAKALAVPFVDTPFNQANGEQPTIECSVNGQSFTLPKYSKGVNLANFKKEWNETNGYALIQGKRFQTFLPVLNKTEALNKNLNQVIDMYDNNIIGFYNELIGLSDNNPDPLNRSSERRYFYKADAHGAGGLYYGGLWAAETSTSADAWLSDGWGALHETGHGYQGSFMNRGMSVGEVWNNLYGVIYDYKHMGKAAADKNSWLYNYGYKSVLENRLKTVITSASPDFNSQDLRMKLIILSNFLDKAGNVGLQNFYEQYRKLANTPGFHAEDYSLPDLLVENLGTPKKYDFSAVLTAWGLKVSENAKKQAKANGDTLVAHLAQVVPGNKLNEAIQQLTQTNRLSSVLSLVTNQELSRLNLKSNITLKFTDEKLFDGVKLRILDGDKVYKEINLNQGPVVLNDMPNGVYALELETPTGYIQKPYLFVRENGTITIPLNSYLKEATEAVNQLFEDNSDTLIKPTIMQKDIDEAKKKVTALPESTQKQQLLQKLDAAFNQLQEFTFKGLGDWTFATFDVAHNVATLRTIAGQPHSGFGDHHYAGITIKRGNEVIFEKEYLGNQNYSAADHTIQLQDGDRVTITHEESGRLMVNHPTLKPANTSTYYYVVQNGQLAIDNVTPALNTVNQLFENGSSTIIKSTVMQKEIDEAKKRVEALPDSSQKQQLLEKLASAFNQLQEITLQGLGDWTFSTLDVVNGIATIRTNPGEPQPYFGAHYASINIKRNKDTVFEKEYIGKQNYPRTVNTIQLQEGDTLTITHQEAGSRFIVNHPDLKPNNSGTYYYIVKNGKLVIDHLKPVITAVDQLFENNNETTIKPSIMQKDIEAAKAKVEALPASPQKQQLLEKITSAFNQLQEFTFQGLGSWNFATLDVTHGVATLRTNAGQPHAYFDSLYASILIKRGKDIVFEKEYIGNQNYPAATNTIHLKDGDTVTIVHKEPGSRFVVNHSDLKPNHSGTYTYTVQNGMLVLVR